MSRLWVRPLADLIVFVSGALAALAFAPVSVYPLALLGPAVLARSWLDVSPRRAAWLGFLFGWGLFGIGVSWVYVAIHDFGYTGVTLAVLLTSMFISILASYVAIAGYAFARWARGRDWTRLLVVFPAIWVLAEWVRGWLFTGFPWLNLGYSQIDSPLRGFAPLLGVYGAGLLVALSAGLLVLATRLPKARRLAVVGAVAVLWLLGWLTTKLTWTTPQGDPFPVALVQGNVPQDTKWRPELVAYTMDLYAELTRAHWKSRLVIWPEAAITDWYHEIRDSYLADLRREAISHGSAIVLGIPVREAGSRRYYNSLVSLSDTVGMYHKRHLVPFGDYLPFEDWLRGVIGFFDLPMSGFSPGPPKQRLLDVGGLSIAPAICYEDAFGEEWIDGLPNATLLVNATNNAWYGNSFAPHQHLEISRMRALETGRYVLRATTNGVSAIIGADGQVRKRSPQFKTFVLTGEAQAYSGATPYVRYGNGPVLIIALAMLLWGIWRCRTDGSEPPGVQ